MSNSLVNFSRNSVVKLVLHASIVVLFFILAFVINRIPEGTIIAGGDFYQLIDFNANLSRYLFTWFTQIGQGQYNPLFVVFPFYAFQAILFKIGFSYANIANSIMFLYFIGSFYSFYFAIKIIYSDIPKNIRLLSSAIYALNIFTFTIFSYSWWITHHFLIYLFIPLLFAAFEKLLVSFSKKGIALYSLLFLISTIGFNNIAFLVAMVFLQILFLIALFITKRISLTLSTTKRIIQIFILQLFSSMYFLLPFVTSQINYLSKVVEGNVIGDFVNWLSYTSTSAYSIFSFTMLGDKYPIDNLYTDSFVFLAISIVYTIVVYISIVNKKDKEEKFWFHYLLFFIPYLFLLMRLIPPYDRINRYLYSLPGFNLFRSPDKLFVFYPFIYLVLLSSSLFYSKFSKRTITILLFIILLLPIPFYIGGIPTYLSNQAGYKYLVKIPKEYYEIEKIVNDEPRQLSIISLPFSVINSINWSNYPKWDFVGFDILHLLFRKLYISANVYDHISLEQKLSFKEYNETNEVNKEEFLELVQKFSGQYILLHNDISKYWQENSETIDASIKDLESDGILLNLEENDYFKLYELDEDYLVPLISSDSADLYFQRINPTQYRIKIKNLTDETLIEFHQTYNPQWKLYLVSNPNDTWCSQSNQYAMTNSTECELTNNVTNVQDLGYLWKKPIFDDSHLMVKDYANGWLIDPEYIKENYSNEFYLTNSKGDLNIEMVINFKPQSYFFLGLIFSGIVFIACLSYIVFDSLKKGDEV